MLETTLFFFSLFLTFIFVNEWIEILRKERETTDGSWIFLIVICLMWSALFYFLNYN